MANKPSPKFFLSSEKVSLSSIEESMAESAPSSPFSEGKKYN